MEGRRELAARATDTPHEGTVESVRARGDPPAPDGVRERGFGVVLDGARRAHEAGERVSNREPAAEGRERAEPSREGRRGRRHGKERGRARGRVPRAYPYYRHARPNQPH